MFQDQKSVALKEVLIFVVMEGVLLKILFVTGWRIVQMAVTSMDVSIFGGFFIHSPVRIC